jgi:hypothetical protein
MVVLGVDFSRLTTWLLRGCVRRHLYAGSFKPTTTSVKKTAPMAFLLSVFNSREDLVDKIAFDLFVLGQIDTGVCN